MGRHQQPRRGGFTLIELLVVIAIIAILIALLVPAVQKVRVAAAITQCSNNLKNLGIAFHSYHDALKELPHGGGLTGNNPEIAPLEFSWPFLIMPYVDQGPLHEKIILEAAASTYTTGDTTPVPVYYCPIRRAVRKYHGQAITDYAGNAGTRTGDGKDGVVVMRTAAKMRLVMITDGTSNTLMLGERRVNIGWLDGTPRTDTGDNEPCIRPQYDGDVRRAAVPSGGSWLVPEPDLNQPDTGSTPPWVAQFGSSHEMGMNALLADGSVHLIRFTVTPVVFRNICQSADGNAVDPSNFD